MNERPTNVIAKRDAAWKSGSLARVVRAFCYECMGGYGAEVPRCTAPECPLFPFRLRRSAAEAFNETARECGWTEPRAVRTGGNADALAAYRAAMEEDEGQDDGQEAEEEDR